MRKFSFLFILFFAGIFISRSMAQEVYTIVQGHPVLLNSGWLHAIGTDTAKWQSFDPTEELVAQRQLKGKSDLQLKLTFRIANTSSKDIALAVEQGGASHIYLDGKLLASYGYNSGTPGKFEGYDPINDPIFLPPLDSELHQLLVDYQIPAGINFRPLINSTFPVFRATLLTREDAIQFFANRRSIGLDYFKIGLLLMLFLVHFIGFLFYPKARLQFYFSLYALFGCIGFILLLQQNDTNLIINKIRIDRYFLLASFCSYIFLLAVFVNLLKPIHPFWVWILVLANVFFAINGLFGNGVWRIVLDFATSLASPVISAWLGFKAMRRGVPAAKYIFSGSIAFFVLWILFLLSYQVPTPPILKDVLFHMAIFAFPISISMVLSQNFMFVSQDLEKQMDEVHRLSIEKQEILREQNVLLEKQVEERTIALTKSLDNLKSTQAQLIQSEKMASLGELTAGIAHEIQNPLNFVNNFSEVNTELINELIVEMNKGNMEEAKMIAGDISGNEQKINHHGKRADSIVKGMLQHSRASASTKEPTDINKLADEYLRLAYHGLRAKDKSFNAVFHTEFDGSIGKISLIPPDIGRALLNLFSNAFYAVHAKALLNPAPYETAVSMPLYEPAVIVGSKRQGDKIVLSVKDNGTGIPKKYVDKVFQPFFTTKPTGEGTGLGLSLAYDIIKAHGGSISMETTEGEGTTFTIALPAK